ncbi:MAG: hypothetical protein GTN40_02405 [Candidatus Aenigmarchaeota archaeon]|nr:hypothetical protein [Candidatus Aenigmarchaeota archaeon]
MKAAVTLITLVIIFVIVVFISLMMWLYLSGFFSEISYAGEVRTEKSLEVLSSCIKIEEAFQNKFFIRNCGNGVITNDSLNVYVDGELFDFDLDPVYIEGKITGSIILHEGGGMPEGQHSLRIINPNTEALAYFEAELLGSYILTLDFDEGEGTIAHDKSGYENDGTLYEMTGAIPIVCSEPPTVDCPKWVKGKFGMGLEFDGVDDFVAAHHDESLRITDENFTIEAWIKTSSTSSPMAIADIFTPSVGVDMGWLFTLEGGKIKLYIAESSTTYASAIGSSDLRDGFWHYVFGNYNGTHIKVYADDKLEGIQSYTGDIWYSYSDPDRALHIGIRCDVCAPQDVGQHFDGIIDEIRIYNVSLTPDETIKFRII